MDRKITGIKPQKKNPERLNIYLDGEFAFGLSRVVAAWLEIGQVLGSQRIDSLLAEDEVETAYQKALRFLSYRIRSEKEMQKKLVEAEFSESVVETVMEKLRNKRYINDDDFTRQWVEGRNQFRPRGKRALTVELRQKGIDEDVIRGTVDEMVDEEALAYQLGLRQSRRINQDTWNNFRVRLGSYLYRRGFSYDTIFPVVERVWSEIRGDDAERSYSNDDNEGMENELSQR